MVSFWSNPTTKDAYRLSIASIIIELGAILVGFLIFEGTESSLSLVYALENLVDVISSVVVLWRFFAPAGSIVDDELERKLQGRENKASIAINWILILLGFFIVLSAISGFARGRNSTENDNITSSVVIVSFWSTIIFGILCTLKIHMSKQLHSESLYKDGLCSFIGTLLSAAMFLHASFFNNTGLWWLDPFLSFIAGLGATIYGIYSLYQCAFVSKIGICCCCSTSTTATTTSTTTSTNNNTSVELGNAPNAINDNEVV